VCYGPVMDTAATDITAGHELRRARESAGITRARLAGLAGCSLSQLAAIETGAVPKRSVVLDRVREVLATLWVVGDTP
jgi:transcriptional regulator with XRE-family HTH domain